MNTQFSTYTANIMLPKVAYNPLNTNTKTCMMNYRYGFNGQEKINEVYGFGNLNIAEFWLYDTRLGRRWNRDPIDQISLSNYSVLSNSPILYNDPNGDIWDRPEDAQRAEGYNNILEIRKNQYLEQANKNQIKSDYYKQKGNEKKATKFAEKANEARAGALEMSDAQIELSKMGDVNEPTRFRYEDNPYSSQTAMDADGVIVMQVSSVATGIHESKHGYQHLVGDLTYLKNGNVMNYGLQDEVQAYRRQYYFMPGSLPSSHSKIVIKNARDISVEWIMWIWLFQENTNSYIYPYKDYSKEK